jgi:hypothetical protein
LPLEPHEHSIHYHFEAFSQHRGSRQTEIIVADGGFVEAGLATA